MTKDRCIEDVGNEGAEDEGYNVIIEEAIEACQELVLVAQESGDEEAVLAAEQCINEHLAGEEGPWNEEPWDEGRGDEVPGEYPSDEEQQQLEDAFAACEALIITAERSGADEDIQAAEACLTEQLGDEFNQHEPPAPQPCDALIELYEQTQDEALIAEIESCFSQDEVASDDEGGSQ